MEHTLTRHQKENMYLYIPCNEQPDYSVMFWFEHIDGARHYMEETVMRPDNSAETTLFHFTEQAGSSPKYGPINSFQTDIIPDPKWVSLKMMQVKDAICHQAKPT